MFEQSFFINFDESDPSGLLFFGRIPAWCHRTIEQFVASEVTGWESWFNHPEWAVPIRHFESNHLKPLQSGTKATAKVFVKSLGESSVVFNCQFFNSNNELSAEASSTHVFVDKKDFKKCPIPNEIRRKLEAHKA